MKASSTPGGSLWQSHLWPFTKSSHKVAVRRLSGRLLAQLAARSGRPPLWPSTAPSQTATVQRALKTAHLVTVVIQRDEAVVGGPGDCNMVPGAVCGCNTGCVVANAALILHDGDAPTNKKCKCWWSGALTPSTLQKCLYRHAEEVCLGLLSAESSSQHLCFLRAGTTDSSPHSGSLT